MSVRVDIVVMRARGVVVGCGCVLCKMGWDVMPLGSIPSRMPADYKAVCMYCGQWTEGNSVVVAVIKKWYSRGSFADRIVAVFEI